METEKGCLVNIGEGQEQESMSGMSDVELARTLAATISGQVCEWPQLRPLLARLADQVEASGRNAEIIELPINRGKQAKDKPVHITIDSRETRPSIEAALKKMPGVTVERADLACGDFILGEGVGVERKSATDFVLSITNDRRLFSQVRLLKATYSRPILIVEGDIFSTRSEVRPEALIGALSYLAVLEGVTVLPTKNERQTAELLATMARHAQNGLGYDIALRAGKPKDLPTLAQFFVEGLPGIGPTAAQKIIAHFGSLRRFVQATPKEIAKVPGIGPKTAERICELLDAELG